MGSTDQEEQEGRELTTFEEHGPRLNKSRREAEKQYVYFWRVDGHNGEFSQWHPTGFKIEEQEFNCAEQYMMYTKAGTCTVLLLIVFYNCLHAQILVRSRLSEIESRPTSWPTPFRHLNMQLFKT